MSAYEKFDENAKKSVAGEKPLQAKMTDKYGSIGANTSKQIQNLLPRTRDLLRTGLVVLGSSLILLAIFLIVHLQNIPKEYSNSHFNLPSDDKFRPHLSDDAPELHENSHVSADPKGVKLPYVYRSYSEMEKDRMMKLRQLPSYRGKSGVEKVLKLVKDSVEKERLKIKDTEPNLWKEGQTSLRILFVSTWRSASTFLGQVLQEHPGVFQHYEPFSYLGVKQIRSGAEAFQSQQNLHKLLDCRYEGLDRYLNYTKFNPADMSGHNKRIWKACKDTQRIDLCSSPDFLAKTCSMFPIQLVKTVRLRLNLTQLFLGESRLKAKIIYLVRDPRATMSSRRSTVKWCQLSEDCSSAQVLCDDLKADLKVSAALARLFPDNFKLVKYEDLANNPVDIVKGIFDFLGLQMTESITDFVKVNTNSDIEKPWSIARKSAARISRWKELLSRTEINEIQSSCSSVIESLGLKLE